MIADAILDAFLDGIKLLPFLFVTYLLMEYIEHKTSGRTEQIMEKSGKWGPVWGSFLGLFPQCGFSAAASNLYAGRVISAGTLIAVFLSTSDEMLPVLISEQAGLAVIFRILGVKIFIGILAGFFVDFGARRKRGCEREDLRIDHLCDHQHCHCREGKIIKSAFSHTLQIFGFIVIITFALNLVIGLVGEERLTALFSGKTVLGPLLAGLIGLIPNCAASVLLTQLYLEGMLGAGAVTAGLLAGAGVGLLVLYRVNDDLKENIKITILLYAIGVLCGILIETAGIVY